MRRRVINTNIRVECGFGLCADGVVRYKTFQGRRYFELKLWYSSKVVFDEVVF